LLFSDAAPKPFLAPRAVVEACPRVVVVDVVKAGGTENDETEASAEARNHRDKDVQEIFIVKLYVDSYGKRGHWQATMMK
jgi:hypothetical protein